MYLVSVATYEFLLGRIEEDLLSDNLLSGISKILNYDVRLRRPSLLGLLVQVLLITTQQS